MRDQADILREPPSTAVDASPIDVPLTRVVTVCLAAGVVLGLLGPLGTGDLSLGLRLGYWMVATVGGGLLGWAATFLVMRWEAARRRPWLMIVAIAVVMTPPGAVLVWAWSLVASPGAVIASFPVLTGSVFLISLVMTAINRLIGSAAPSRGARPASTVTPVAAASPAALPLVERLPLRLRGAEIYAVQAEDHYLRVHTAKGSDLILLRLSDALAELAALEGARTHRSWWVARAAVREVAKSDGRAILTLEGGLKVPVSRANAAALRAAGWF